MLLETCALVVEDDPNIRRHLVRGLRTSIRQVDEAGDGEQAVALFLAHHHPLVVLDLRLPKLDGLEVFRRLRDADSEAQVVIMTGHGNKDDAIAAVNLHAYYFFEKPLSLEKMEVVLCQAYDEYVAKAESRSTLRSPATSQLEDEISDLYDKLSRLSVVMDAPGFDDQDTRNQYAMHFEELRKLQASEAMLLRDALREVAGLDRGMATSLLDAASKELNHGE